LHETEMLANKRIVPSFAHLCMNHPWPWVYLWNQASHPTDLEWIQDNYCVIQCIEIPTRLITTFWWTCTALIIWHIELFAIGFARTTISVVFSSTSYSFAITRFDSNY
jgi:hypothetical protein